VPRLLFCWELGANFGHVASMAALYPALAAVGYEVSFAVADLYNARQLLARDAHLLQSPVWPLHRHGGGRVLAASFADTLTLVGFGVPEKLGAVVDGWLSLFNLIAPDVVVADHSPAAQIAAHLIGCRLITVGTGFTQPPLNMESLPPLRADVPPAQPEQVLLASALQVLSERGASKLPATLTQLLAADARLVVGLPELDPYRSFRREAMLAPVGGFAQPGDRDSPRLFAYLGAEMPNLEEKIQVLCDLPIDVEIFVRGGSRLLIEFIRMRGKIAHDRPVVMREALSRVSHVLSQGGAMLASEALAAGCPQLLLPLHLEPKLNADLICQVGAGRQADPHRHATEFRRDLTEVLADSELAARTRNIALMLRQRPLETIDAALLRALTS
jgi:rhamnosyltransferase subunit B